jgi:hypothetical protein
MEEAKSELYLSAFAQTFGSIAHTQKRTHTHTHGHIHTHTHTNGQVRHTQVSATTP